MVSCKTVGQLAEITDTDNSAFDCAGRIPNNPQCQESKATCQCIVGFYTEILDSVLLPSQTTITTYTSNGSPKDTTAHIGTQHQHLMIEMAGKDAKVRNCDNRHAFLNSMVTLEIHN